MSEQNRLAPTAEQLFQVYAPRAYRLARHILGNESDAEVVASKVLLQVMRELPAFRGKCWVSRQTARAARALRAQRLAVLPVPA